MLHDNDHSHGRATPNISSATAGSATSVGQGDSSQVFFNAAQRADLLHNRKRRLAMFKYGLAWFLGVPMGLLILIYLLFHL